MQPSTFLVVVVLFVVICTTRGLRVKESCAGFQSFYRDLNLNHSTPQEVIRGSHLKICPARLTCCTVEVERDLREFAAADFREKIELKSKSVSDLFGVEHQKFDEFFKDLIDSSATQLDQLFVDTYGHLYSDNSRIFTELFHNLKDYYRGGPVMVDDIFDEFFTGLMQKVFELLNRSYILDDDYMGCIADNMYRIKPFKDIPQRLSAQVQRAFIAARTFVHGFHTGMELTRKLAQISPTKQCSSALVRMKYCGRCELTTINACRGLCSNVARMCLCEYNQLHPVWLEYINAMDMLLSRLKGPFNVEVLLRRIDLTISDAIMTVQENEKEITKVVFHHCGEPQQNPNTTHPMMNMGYEPPPPGFPQMTSDDTDTIPYPSLYPGYQGPSNFDNLASYTDAWDDEISQGDLPLSRKTRSTKKSRKEKRKRNRSRDVEHQRNFRRPHAVEDKYEYREDAFEPAPSNGNNLETLLSEVRIMLESARHHWGRMEEGVCGDAVGGEECWNGGSIGRYESKVVKPDASCTDFNPENEPPAHMEPSVHMEPPVHTKHAIRSQVVVLRDTIIKLRMAHNGVDESTEDHDTEIATDVESSGEESSGDIGSGEVPNQPGAHEVAAPECMDCNPGNHGNHLSINLVTITTTIFITMLNMV